MGKETTAEGYWLWGPSPQDRPSCITDGNLFHGQNVGQLCRPPPLVTFDLTTLPMTAPIRLPLLGDVTPVYPMTVQLTRRDVGGASEVFAHSRLAVASSPRPSLRIILLESCSASLWSLQNKISKTHHPKREFASGSEGIVNNTTTVESLRGGGQPEYISSQMTRKNLCGCFGEFVGYRTY